MKLIILLSCIPVFLATGFSLFVYKKLSAEFRVFTWFLVVSGIVQLISLLLWWLKINNMPILHLYVPLGFSCLAWFYKTVFRDFVHHLFVPLLIGLFVLFCIVNSVFLQSVFSYNSTALMVEAVLVIILALSTFLLSQNKIAQEGKVHTLQGLNWINSGLFIFFASSSLLYYYGDIITRSLPVYLGRYVWVLHSFFSVIMYTCFLIGIWKSLKK